MPTSSATDILLATAKDLTAALRQSQRNPLLPPPDTQTRQALVQLNEIFSNATKPNVTTNATLPRVPNDKPPTAAALPRVPLTTTSDYLTMTANNRRLRRKNQHLFKQAPPTNQPFSSLPPQESNNSVVTTVQLPPKLRQLVNNEIRRASDPTANPFHNLNAVLNADSGKLEEYRHLLKGKDKALWEKGCSKEIARLAQGRANSDDKGTNTLHFIHPRQLPKDKKPTYLRICANYRPQKADPYRIRFTVGGNLVNYNGETYTPTADLTTAKLLLNSVVSTPGATFFCLDLSNFYLKTPFAHPSQYEYLYIPEWAIPEDIMQEYNLRPLIKNKQLLAEIRTGMYGLPQAGRLAYVKLIKHLADDGYVPTGHTPGLFHHITRPTTFNLVVDDFGVKVVGQTHAEHLIHSLKKHYDVTIDRGGKIFCGIHLDWDYTNRTVDLSMPDYVTKALARLRHPSPKKPQHSPHPYTTPVYGQKQQYAKPTGATCQLTPAQVKFCQEFTGIFNYYARAIDNTMQTAVSSIASSISTSTWKDIRFRIDQFLDYAATHPDARIQYKASEMQLWIHTDASYLNESKARSRNGGYYYLSKKPKLPISPDDPPPPHNAPILVNSKIIDAVMSSVQESETGSGFINAKDAVPICTTLQEMGHPQGPTPLQFDNKCAVGILTDTVVQRRSKAMDMRFYWVRDRHRQKQFHVHWKRGQENLADYPTKHHSTKHHIAVRPTYVLNNLRRNPNSKFTRSLSPNNPRNPLVQLNLHPISLPNKSRVLQNQPASPSLPLISKHALIRPSTRTSPSTQRHCKGVLNSIPLNGKSARARPLTNRYNTYPLQNDNVVAKGSQRLPWNLGLSMRRNP
jgi:hypothetical protein